MRAWMVPLVLVLWITPQARCAAGETDGWFPTLRRQAAPPAASPSGPEASGTFVTQAGHCAVQDAPRSRPNPPPPAHCAPQFAAPPPPCRPAAPCPQAAPVAYPQAAPLAYPQAAPGMFAAPQARGEVAGESESLGIRGFAIHIPAIRLELPSIQLPSFIRYRRQAEMRVEEAYAPYTAGAPAVYGQLVPGGTAVVSQRAYAMPPAAPQRYAVPPQQPPAPASPQSAEACDTDPRLRAERLENERVIRELQAQLDALRRRIDQGACAPQHGGSAVGGVSDYGVAPPPAPVTVPE